MNERYRTTAQASSAHRRKVVTGLTVGLLSVSALGVVTASANSGSGSKAAKVETVSSISGVAGRDAASGKAETAAVGGMVFVQSNNPEQNSVLAFDRAVDGSLTPAPSALAGNRSRSRERARHAGTSLALCGATHPTVRLK